MIKVFIEIYLIKDGNEILLGSYTNEFIAMNNYANFDSKYGKNNLIVRRTK